MDKKRIIYAALFILWITSIIYLGFYGGPLSTYTINGSCGYHTFTDKKQAEEYYNTYCRSHEVDPLTALSQNFSNLRK